MLMRLLDEQDTRIPFYGRWPFYLAENDAASDAMFSRHGPCYAANLVALSKISKTEKMSYNASAHYAAEAFIKNHPDGLLKAIIGKLSGRKRP